MPRTRNPLPAAAIPVWTGKSGRGESVSPKLSPKPPHVRPVLSRSPSGPWPWADHPAGSLPPGSLISYMSGLALLTALKEAPRDPETKMLATFMKRAIVAWIEPPLSERLCDAIDGYLRRAHNRRGLTLRGSGRTALYAVDGTKTQGRSAARTGPITLHGHRRPRLYRAGILIPVLRGCKSISVHAFGSRT